MSVRTVSHAAGSLEGRLINTFRMLRESLRDAAEKRRARAELMRLDDHELADLGIHRGEIDRVVETGRRGGM